MNQDAYFTDREAEALEKTIFLSDIEDKGVTEPPVMSQDTKGKNCNAVIRQGAESVEALSIKLGNLDVVEGAHQIGEALAQPTCTTWIRR
jgi:hypothetical protein